MKKAVLMVAFIAICGALASADTLTWNLSGVVMTDGTTVTGSFDYNADTNTWSNLNITTSGGSSVPASSNWFFDLVNPNALQNAAGIAGFEAVSTSNQADLTGAYLISLFSTDGQQLTNAGGTISLEFFVAGTCRDSTCANFNTDLPHSAYGGQGAFVNGSQVPEPTSLVLFGSGALALVRRLRKA